MYVQVRYVTDILCIVSDSGVACIPDIIDVNMIAGFWGKFICPQLHYKKNPTEIIANFAFVQNNQGVSENFHIINQDLNEDVGRRLRWS